jgi:hypothetical protein
MPRADLAASHDIRVPRVRNRVVDFRSVGAALGFGALGPIVMNGR